MALQPTPTAACARVGRAQKVKGAAVVRVYWVARRPVRSLPGTVAGLSWACRARRPPTVPRGVGYAACSGTVGGGGICQQLTDQHAR